MKKETICDLLSVDPKGVEPLSSCVIKYAFYMCSFPLIVGRGKVGREPIPFSVFAKFRF